MFLFFEGYVATKGETLNIMNAYSDDRFNKEVDKKMNYKTNTILCVPIMSKGNQVLGVIQAINKLNGFFNKEDEGLLAILANLGEMSIFLRCFPFPALAFAI